MKMRVLKNPVQLSLFDTGILKSENLTAPHSPRKAIYKIWLIREPGGFVVKKESGGEMKKHTIRQWFFPSLRQAETYYERKIKDKTNPARKSRVYQKPI